MGDAAVGALGDVAAEGALQGGGEAAPVEEEDGLFFAFEALGDGFLELRGKDGRAFAEAGGLAEVHDADDGHLDVVDAFEHFEEGVFAARCTVVRKLSSEGVAEPRTTVAPSIWPRTMATSRAW